MTHLWVGLLVPLGFMLAGALLSTRAERFALALFFAGALVGACLLTAIASNGAFHP